LAQAACQARILFCSHAVVLEVLTMAAYGHMIVHGTLAVLLCVQVCVWMRRIRFSVIAQMMRQIRSIVKCAPGLIQGACKTAEQQETDDWIADLVRHRMDADVVQSMRTASAFLTYVYTWIVVSILLHEYQKAERWMTFEQDVVLLLVAGSHTLLASAPSLITPRTVHLVYVSHMFSSMLFIVFAAQEHFAAFASLTTVCAVRFAYSLAYLNQTVIPAANIISTAATCTFYMFSSYDSVQQRLLLFEVGTCIYVIVMARSLWRSRTSTVRQEITATMLQGENNSLSMLLTLMCDVVVEVNEDLCIVDDSPKLSALLTLGGRTKSLKGAKLQDFMPSEEDRQNFQQRLLEPMRSDGMSEDIAGFLPGALPVKMLDSLGNSLTMEIYYTQCNRLSQRRFFLGLREYTDEPIRKLKGFPRRKNKRESRRAERARRHSQMTQSESAASSAQIEGDSLSGSNSSDPELSDPAPEDEDHDVPQLGGLMNPLWEPTTEKGKLLIVINALKRCNILVGQSWCCPWHAAVGAMKEMLTKLKGVSCATGFTAEGDWQCGQCKLLDSVQDSRATETDEERITCRMCSFHGMLRQRSTRITM